MSTEMTFADFLGQLSPIWNTLKSAYKFGKYINDMIPASYRNCVEKTIKMLLGHEAFSSFEECHILSMAEDAKRLVEKCEVSIEDAAILAMVNFRADLKVEAGIRPEGKTSDERYFDDIDLKLFSHLSTKAYEKFFRY